MNLSELLLLRLQQIRMTMEKLSIFQTKRNLRTVVQQQTGFFRTGLTIHLDYTEGTAGYGHKVLGVAAGSIGKVNGVATANVGKVNSVD